MAMTEAVGPITTPEADPFAQTNGSAMAVPDFVAGFIYGLTGDLELTEIEACMTGAHGLEQYLTSFVNHIKHLHILKAAWDIQKFVFNLEKDLAPCAAIETDLKKVEEWAAIFTHPRELGESTSFAYLMHKEAIMSNIASMSSGWGTGDYFNSGVAFADAATTLLGPAPTSIVEDEADFFANSPAYEVNHMLAGFIYGMTTKNHLTEIEACYDGGAEMEHELVRAIHDFKAGGWNYITQGCL